jgi:hypothetical protein
MLSKRENARQLIWPPAASESSSISIYLMQKPELVW